MTFPTLVGKIAGKYGNFWIDIAINGTKLAK
jgi:hypothetical protein